MESMDDGGMYEDTLYPQFGGHFGESAKSRRTASRLALSRHGMMFNRIGLQKVFRNLPRSGAHCEVGGYMPLWDDK